MVATLPHECGTPGQHPGAFEGNQMQISKHTAPSFRASDELEMFDTTSDSLDVLIRRLEVKIAKRAARLRAAYPPGEITHDSHRDI